MRTHIVDALRTHNEDEYLGHKMKTNIEDTKLRRILKIHIDEAH